MHLDGGCSSKCFAFCIQRFANWINFPQIGGILKKKEKKIVCINVTQDVIYTKNARATSNFDLVSTFSLSPKHKNVVIYIYIYIFIYSWVIKVSYITVWLEYIISKTKYVHLIFIFCWNVHLFQKIWNLYFQILQHLKFEKFWIKTCFKPLKVYLLD